MPLVALIGLLPTILHSASEIANIIQEMHTSGQTETTAEQDERLAASLARRKAADDAYDALASS